MMSKRLIYIVALFSLLIQKSFAQNEETHHTYAIVVGISSYYGKDIPDLKYADKDALMFANFLKSKIVRPADTGNIKVLLNESATTGAFWNKLREISDPKTKSGKAKEGDTVFLYFSGHGDATTPADIFLLCNDASRGIYESGGAINITMLKNRIKIMQADGIQVFLIMDACRINEVSKTIYKQLFKTVLDENSGEIQMTSCSQNEKSWEDARWGNGHGVFTWYLLKGWMGLADRDSNNQVNFYELSQYIREQVKNDLKNYGNTLQNPTFSDGNDNTVLASVNPDLKRKLKQDDEMARDNTLYYALTQNIPKGADDNLMEDSIALEYKAYYRKLINLIGKEQFLTHEGEESIENDTSTALGYYLSFKASHQSWTRLEDSKYDLITGMASKAQSYIQNYLRGDDSITMSEFHYAARLMNQCLNLIDTSNELYTTMRARALFLEANSMMRNQTEMITAFNKLDSSLKLEPDKAYVFYSKARIYEKFSIYFKEAEENYMKAIKLAPKWASPLIDLGNMYINNGQFDKGTAFFNQAISIQPIPYTYTLLGHTYHYSSAKAEYSDTALMYYDKALAIDSTYIDAILGKAVVYLYKNMVTESIAAYLKAMALDTTYYYTYMSFGDLFYDAYMNDRAELCYKKAIRFNPDCIRAHWMLGNLYNNRLDDKDKAIDAYDQCLKINYYYTKAYNAIGNIYLDLNMYKDAIAFLKYPLTYDPNYDPINLARAYLNREPKDSFDYDSAKMWLDTSNYYFPNEYYTHYLYGFYYWKLNDSARSIASCRESIKLNNNYYYSWLTLGHDYYFLKKDYDSAIFYYDSAILKGPDKQEAYQYLRDIYHFVKQDYARAITVADSAIANNANKHHFYFLKCLSLWQYKSYNDALIAIDSAIWLYPGYSNYYFYKASVLSSLNRIDEAIDFLKLAVEYNLNAAHEDFYGGRFKNLEGNKKFEKLVKKYLKKKEKEYQ